MNTDPCADPCALYLGCSKNLKLSICRGDSATLTLPTEVDISGATNLIFTAKRSAYDPDSNAVVQKSLNFGLGVLSSREIALEFVPLDTQDLESERDRALIWDVQMQSGSEIKTVAKGQLCIRMDVTQNTSTSIPVYTHAPPLSGFSGGVSDGFTYVQVAPSATWIIDHMLGHYPNVEVYDDQNNLIVGDIQNPTVNRTIIVFNAPFSGHARLD